MAVYTQLDFTTIAGFIATHYNVGTLTGAEGIAQGVENTNYWLTVADENGSARDFILTLYEKRVDPHDLPFFLGLMKHVAARGVACPAPVHRRDDALYGPLAGKQAALVHFLAGRSCAEITPTHAAAVGDLLGALHRATADFQVSRRNALSLDGWQTIAAALAGRLDNIAPGLDALVANELAYLQGHWPRDLLPRGVIHADLFPDNVFFTGDKVSGVIDFYFACDDALAYDLAITVNAWCFDADGKWNAGKFTQLMAGYEMQHMLGPAEKTALPVLLRGAALRFLLTRAHDWLHQAEKALVVPHDPREYIAKLQFHRQHFAKDLHGIA